MQLMTSRDVVLLGLVDCAMMSMGVVSVIIQNLTLKGYVDWSRLGWILQNAWQAIFLGFFIWFTQLRSWQWTHAVFITLHTICILMKQHSYAFYNGYLSGVYKRRAMLQAELKVLKDQQHLSPTTPLPTIHATSYFDASMLNQMSDRKRPRQIPYFDEDVLAVASTIGSDTPLSADQLRSLRKLLRLEVAFLALELRGTCQKILNYYPKNLTAKEWFFNLPLPTLVYELEYARVEKINWYYVAEKTAATFGVLWVMVVISTAYIYPVVDSILQMTQRGVPLATRLHEFPWTLLDLLLPMFMEYMLCWYVIWECVTNLLAELTCFADRGFYADWWNSVSWDQFARDWNRPVHNFLLRFAYHSSIATWKLSRSAAALITFVFSALVHELIMAIIFRKIRGYLFCLQMAQVPLIMLSRTRFFRSKTILGNIQFWTGILLAPSLICTLYLFL